MVELFKVKVKVIFGAAFHKLNETGSLSPCMRPRSDPPKMKNPNVVRSRLIILINEEFNKANWMVSNSVKLDRKTKQHTQFGVSASNGSRDMAQTKSWRKKNNKANWMVSNSAQLDCRPSSTLNLESLRVTVPEIWPGQNRGKIVAEKKK